ncbi:2-dehydropantoate 2-reductase [Cryptosporangium aurantiacum]|uniref:2-dehydropantoate 2-reductase n=1 Tax=Cryptosporangium aurantiacum TaxID=134849 RepID=A0A1M7K1B1_9ACTN|nr:2-dehydropantoate 2-reductase [Cryptosporangium aurantiacum]SHM59079.1 ketopantoate reductase [Cryptosporangium aurantiacum]
MPERIAVLGAGLIGLYIGGALHAAGADVSLVGRARMRPYTESTLVLTDLDGGRTEVPAGTLEYSLDPTALSDAGLVLVTVKSADTAAAAEIVAANAPQRPVVLSLQNGVGNLDVLQTLLPGYDVVAGMVPFNVANPEPGRLHRASEGGLMAARTSVLDPWLPVFAAAGLPVTLRADFVPVQWGKLLLNLNNAVNALSGVPLRAELSRRAYRQSLALLVAEALRVLRAAGIQPARVTKVPPHVLPTLLRVPDAVFTRLAGAMLRIDPEARSSMREDLAAGRRTEVDHLNGAVVRLAQRAGVRAPVNQAVVDLIHAAEHGPPPSFTGDELYARLSAAAR